MDELAPSMSRPTPFTVSHPHNDAAIEITIKTRIAFLIPVSPLLEFPAVFSALL